MIRRRACIVLTITSALLLSRPISSAQPAAAKIYRVGVLNPAAWDADSPGWNDFVAEMTKRGYVEGRNLVFEKRFADLPDNFDLLDKLAAELVELKVDVIYAARGTPSALAAKKATTTIPIVFYSSSDPVGNGLVASLSRPGGNLTGSAILGGDTASKRLQFFAEAIGKLTTVAYIQPVGTRSFPWYAPYAATVTKAAKLLGITVLFVDVESFSELEPLVKRLVRQGIGGATLLEGQSDVQQRRRAAALFIENRLPSMGDAREGFLLDYDVQFRLAAETAAKYVDKILKGAKPADLPVEQVSTYQLVINLKTARALGLNISPSLLQQADEVIQ